MVKIRYAGNHLMVLLVKRFSDNCLLNPMLTTYISCCVMLNASSLIVTSDSVHNFPNSILLNCSCSAREIIILNMNHEKFQGFLKDQFHIGLWFQSAHIKL